MATIEIDGKLYEAQVGQMLIEVTDANGIHIPRFCYHKKLSVAANCRMCLVEVERAPKPVPACATPVMDGMKVFTRSPKALAAQKAVMEFLLINHPLDCPICDQGGECELQDMAVGYGGDSSRYREEKRVVFDRNISPLIATEMTRCIHCTRCVRFGMEISGIQELGAVGRGEHTRIGTFLESSVSSELSGNVIDLCPVGALTSKPFRFAARAWEVQQRDTIAPHDSVGSNLHLHVRRNKVLRVAPKENEAINEVWIADRDRFSYQGLYTPDRLTTPLLKREGIWHEVDWETALTHVAERLKQLAEAHKGQTEGKSGLKQVMSHHKKMPLGVLASPTATLEELYLLQKVMRGIGCQNIDHRLRQTDFSDQEQAPLFPSLGQAITDLEQCQTVLVIGAHLRKEQPLLNHRLRKATMRGAKVLLVNPVDYTFNLPITEKIIVPPAEIVLQLAGIAKALLNKVQEIPTGADTLLAGITANERHGSMAQYLLSAEKSTILLGNLATAHPQFAIIRALSGLIAQLSGTQFSYLPEAANTAGAWLAGAVPHRHAGGEPAKPSGFDVQAMLDHEMKAYFLLGLEPELDTCYNHALLTALKQADFVVSLTAYRTPTLEACAEVLLPIALFAETAGTYVNCEGQWQSFQAAVLPPGSARPAWKVLRVLGNLLDVAGIEYVSSEQVRDEVRQLVGNKVPNNEAAWQLPKSLSVETVEGLQRITELPIYASDALVRRATALQNTSDARITGGIHINTTVATQTNLQDGQTVQVSQNNGWVSLPVVIDERVPDRCALIYAGQVAATELGAWHGQIRLLVE
jgi:NADH-quinone oxidoreductase subunit G